MNPRQLMAASLALILVAGCTYDSVRRDLRRNCERMLDSERERCLRRTADTQEEYDAKRAELRRSVEGRATDAQDKEEDPRHAEWIP